MTARESYELNKELYFEYTNDEEATYRNVARKHGVIPEFVRRRILAYTRSRELTEFLPDNLKDVLLDATPDYGLFLRILKILKRFDVFDTESFLYFYRQKLLGATKEYVHVIGVGPKTEEVLSECYARLTGEKTNTNDILEGEPEMARTLRKGCKFCGAGPEALVTEEKKCKILGKKKFKFKKEPQLYVKVTTCTACDNMVRCSEPYLKDEETEND